MRSVEFGDLDGDRDVDAFVLRLDRPNEVWINDGLGNFLDSGQRMGDLRSSAAALGDVDSDGDLDAIVANTAYFLHDGSLMKSAEAEQNTVWYNDGNGVFSDSGQSLGTDNSTGTALADLDGDGDLDAVFANGWDDTNIWLNDGLGVFARGQSLEGSDGALGDMDRDGDIDIVTSNAWQMLIYSNDGNGRFEATGEVYDGLALYAFDLGDIDGDDDIDMIVAIEGYQPDKEVPLWPLWFRGGESEFFPRDLELNGAGYFFFVADLFDVDSDGDMDAVVGQLSDVFDEIVQYVLFLNDGFGNFREQSFPMGTVQLGYSPGIVAFSPLGPRRATFADVDDDGDDDVFMGGRLWLNYGPIEPGDANRDFQFDQQDIVKVLQAAKFLSGVPATFEDGDWDGNGVFDQLDLVIALQTGNYLRGSYIALKPDAAIVGINR